MMTARTQAKFFLPLLVLLIGTAIYYSLVNSKTERERPELTEKVWQIEVLTAQQRELSPSITLYGRIESPEQLKAAAPGGGIVEIIQNSGLQLLGAGVIVTLVPTLVGYFFSRKILNLNPAEALGGVTGSMTSGAALSVVTDAAKSNAPALGYTGAYAFANVILTLAGTLIMLV